MVAWKLVVKSERRLPENRPFIAYWRDSICLIQYDPELEKFICSAFPVRHMHMIELRDKDVQDITHWMELPHAPVKNTWTGDSRKGNYARYTIRSIHGHEEKDH